MKAGSLFHIQSNKGRQRALQTLYRTSVLNLTRKILSRQLQLSFYCQALNLNASDCSEFPHYKHVSARSESQSEAVKRNDIMLHITSHSESFPEHDFQKTDDGGINYCKLSHWLKE